MKAPEDVVVLIDLLDRQVQHLLLHPDASVLLGLPAFIDFLATEPRLASLVVDMVAEADAYHKSLVGIAVEALGELKDTWNEVRPKLEAVRNADTDDNCLWVEKGFDNFGTGLNEPPDDGAVPLQTPPEWLTERRLLLAHWVKCGVQCNTINAQDRAVLEAATERLNLVEQRLAEVWTISRLRVAGHGGFAFEYLREHADLLIPRPTDGSDGELAALKNQRADHIWRQIETYESFRSMAGVQLDIDQVVHWVERLHLDLQSRLARGRSRAAIVRRYAARCETFDRPRLLQVIDAARGQRKVEEVLTLDFARYLFDMGFNPLVDPRIAGLRPDLLDPSLRPGLYVEAKQYTRASKASFSKYVNQVFDTWGRLRNTYDLPEAFLLVFRREGRLVDLPEVVKSQGRALHLHLVDLAPATKAGSRAKASPLVLTESDLMPEEEV